MSDTQERAILLFVVITVLLVTPMRAFWLQTWWAPFAFWLLIILVLALLRRSRDAA
ncbi:MAG: hypothetical protein AAGF92_23885 [Myxococcota bacterium]